MSKQKITMSAVVVKPSIGDVPGQYQFDFEVEGVEGVDFFCMLAEFLHQAPPWVVEHVGMAIDFHRQHDRGNCPYCRAQS